MVKADRVKTTFVDLIRINSPSKSERGVADYVKAKLAALGFSVEEDDAAGKIGGTAGNVIAFKPGAAGAGVPIFLCCHMDTVEATENLKVIDDGSELRSDGSTILGADDKAGIAAVLEGLESVLESGAPHGDIQVLFDASEEVGLLGAKAMDHSKIKARMGYVFDTEKPVAGITVSAPSHQTMTVEITGRAAHAGIAPEKGISAVVAASRAIAKMRLGRIDEETTANVGRVEGGKARNIIPEHVTVTAEARSRSEQKLLEQVEHMKRLFEEEASAIGASAQVLTEREYSGYRWSEDDEVVRLAARAARRIGIEPAMVEGGGGSDANIFNAAGIPAVVVGVGYEGAHSSSEHLSIADLAKTAQFAEALILTAAEFEG